MYFLPGIGNFLVRISFFQELGIFSEDGVFLARIGYFKQECDIFRVNSLGIML